MWEVRLLRISQPNLRQIKHFSTIPLQKLKRTKKGSLWGLLTVVDDFLRGDADKERRPKQINGIGYKHK